MIASRRTVARPVTWITKMLAVKRHGLEQVESTINTGQVRTLRDKGIEELAQEDISRVLRRLLAKKTIRRIRIE